MSVPFGPNEQEPFKEEHFELALTEDQINKIALRVNEAASQVSVDIARSKLPILVERESRHSQEFCRLARHIGASAFPHPDEGKRTLRAEAIEYGIITGHIFGRALVGNGRTLQNIQLDSARSVVDIFTRNNNWDDYQYWVQPRPGSHQEDAVKLFQHRSMIHPRHAVDDTTESLFYNTAGYFAANGIALYITKTSKLRTFIEGLEIKAAIKKYEQADDLYLDE